MRPLRDTDEISVDHGFSCQDFGENSRVATFNESFVDGDETIFLVENNRTFGYIRG